MELLKRLIQLRWYLLLVILAVILAGLSFTHDWRYSLALAALAGSWLIGLRKVPAWLEIVNGQVTLRHDLGWVMQSVSLSGVSKVILYKRPIPPGEMRMDVRNGVLHIDRSRVHTLCISRFTEQCKEAGLEVDSSRIRKDAFKKKGPGKIKFKYPGSR